MKKKGYIKILTALLNARKSAYFKKDYTYTNFVDKCDAFCKHLNLTRVSMNLANTAINNGVWR